MKRYFIELAPSEGVEILFDEEVDTNMKDFKSIIAKISKLQGLQGVFNNLYVGQVGIFARQSRELGVKVPQFDIELFEDTNEVKLSGGALEGQFYVNAPSGAADFAKRYKERFPSDSPFAAANCYDFIGLIASAPNLSQENFREYLFNLKDYQGAVGEVSSTGDQRFSLPAVVKEIRNGKFEESKQN